MNNPAVLITEANSGFAHPLFQTLAGVLLILLNACSQQNTADTTPSRPVKVFRVTADPAIVPAGFAAEIRPRYETALSFRVAGKILQRAVEIGDKVKKGQLLAKLDNSDYQLALQTLNAQHNTALAERDFAKADLERYRQLLAQQVISQPELDRHQTAWIAAEQRLSALTSQLQQAANQVTYTQLAAERDGIVTALTAEQGQVVGAGQTVLKLAETAEKEAVFDLPEQDIDKIRLKQPLQLTLSAKGEQRFPAQVREIAAQADPATRTFRIKASLSEPSPAIHLGMTATVWLDNAAPGLIVPLSAVFSSHNTPSQNQVWLVDEASHQVNAIAVGTGPLVDSEHITVSGLHSGQLLVSAGVQRLLPQQIITISQE